MAVVYDTPTAATGRVVYDEPTLPPQGPVASFIDSVGRAMAVPGRPDLNLASAAEYLNGLLPGQPPAAAQAQQEAASAQAHPVAAELGAGVGHVAEAASAAGTVGGFARAALPAGRIAGALATGAEGAAAGVGAIPASPLLGAVTGATGGALAGGVAGKPRTEPDTPTGGVEHPIVQVQRNGFQIAPNDIPRVSSTPASDVPGTTRQGMTETPAVTAARNQANTIHATRIAAQDIGLPPTDIITPEHTAAARIPPGATYDRVGAAVGGIEKPLTDAPAALDAAVNDNSQYAMPPKAKAQADRVSQGLQSGKYTGPQIIQDISYFRTVPGGKDVADALEGELGAQVQAKAPAMQGDYQDARTMFAKIRDVEDSLNGSVVNPQKLKQMRDGARERPLSGGLNDIAEAAAQAPNSVKLPGAVTGGEVPLSKVGIVTRGVKATLRPFVPMPSQANIANSARGGGPIPMGPSQRGLPGLGDSLAQ